MKKKSMHKFWRLCMAAITVISCVFGMERVHAQEKKGVTVQYKDNIHYVNDDPDWMGKNIVLFCMNNQLNWPHYVPQMGDGTVPSYNQGYLTEKDFASRKDYEECMHRLARLLYIGFPYNGEHMYKIVEEDQVPIPSKSEFDHMLKVTPILAKAFPYLDGQRFSYKDWENHDQKKMDLLLKFLGDTGKLFFTGGTTSNGLTHGQIVNTPFYKAASSMAADTGEDPMHNFASIYGDDYYVTRTQAYEATQNAVWKTLCEYKIPDNNLSSLQPLAEKLFESSLHGDVLHGEPDVDRVKLAGDVVFTYNGEDQKWHTGEVYVEEPAAYHGKYQLQVPAGMEIISDDPDYVFGNEGFEIVSDHEPKMTEGIDITVDFQWLQDMKQYSPSKDVEYLGKKFQNMIGAVILHKTVSSKYMFLHDDTGALEISKEVLGKEDSLDFTFTVTFSDKSLNGAYGDVVLHDGVGKFTLHHGEKKVISALPSGVKYECVEDATDGYQITSNNASGEIVKKQTVRVSFVNTYKTKPEPSPSAAPSPSPSPTPITSPKPTVSPKPSPDAETKPETGVKNSLLSWTGLTMIAVVGITLLKK